MSALLLKTRFSEGEPLAHAQNGLSFSQVGQFSALASHFKPHIWVAAFVFQVAACTMRFTCCVMTDKWLTWGRQVGSGVELPAYLPCIPSQTFPQEQKELSVLLIAQRKTFVMELGSSCGATAFLPKDWDIREGPCNTNIDRALIDCCFHSVACLQLGKRAWICVSCKGCPLILFLLQWSFHSLRPCSIPLGIVVVLSSSQFRPKRKLKTTTNLWAKVLFVPSPAVKCKWKYFYARNEV